MSTVNEKNGDEATKEISQAEKYKNDANEYFKSELKIN